MEGRRKEMTANKFATVLHRKTHRMTFLLIYSALEWILIVFLFLNAIFSYLISKFASFFGLRPPCIFCSRIDHLFESGKGRSSCRDFLCEPHAGEVSRLGFCSSHRRLADAGDMCEDCTASKPGEADRNFSHLSWMKRSEQGEKDLRCSCCGVALESGYYSPYLLKSGSRDVLECLQREKPEIDEVFGLEEADKGKGQNEGEGDKDDESKVDALLSSPRVAVDDGSMDVLAFRVEKVTDLERFIPIELIDSSTMAKFPQLDIVAVAKEESMAESGAVMMGSENVTVHEKHSYILLPAEDPCDDFSTVNAQNVEVVLPVEESDEHHASEEDSRGNEESNCEISIGSEICDQEQIEQTQFHEIAIQPDSMAHQHPNGISETIIKDPDNTVTETEPSDQPSRRVKHLKICPILNEVEDERVMPETPTTPNYIDCFPIPHKRFLLERRESLTESLDGSIAGDIDNLEPLTVDRLKTVLQSERRALIALYAELEEERSASAIAANQTMAMITRLQEEKAAMQMEALQYQRMMEEQSEYDQEALQLLNERMMKREKEKQELEKKLEVYRQKVRVYESMERRRAAKGSRSGSFSSTEESDDLSIESHEGEDISQNARTSEFLGSMEEEDDAAAIKHLVQFEEERLSILEQLKTLEEKLFTVKDANHLPIENGHGINGDCELPIKVYREEKRVGSGGKRLLPLFEVISLENEDDGSYKKLAIVEEVDHAYERLQALEADCEFLKHCLSSLKKGDRGLDLLQEILQHLRDLRITELHSRHIGV